MEGYGLDGLAASAESVLAGLGPLAVGLARLAAEAGQAVTLDEMEVVVAGRGKELLCGVVQLSLDAQAGAEVRVAGVTGADGVRRSRAERGHARSVVTGLGEVRVQRIAYRSGVKGVPSLFPRDAVLNLPPLGYSWPLQRLAVMCCRSGSYEHAREFVAAATGVSVGKRQPEQITAAAAADAERFCQDRPGDRAGMAGEEEGGQAGRPLALSADGKGVAMRPRGPPQHCRGPGPAGPELPQAAGRRDPARRPWIALVDGDTCQIGQILGQAAGRGVSITILIDFIHVLEYLWKAAWCFHPARDPAAEDWVTAQALDILHGRSSDVTTRIRQLAEDHPLQGTEHARIIRRTLHYLEAKQPYLNYPAALASGWPIATGVIEGACRHLVQDRMGMTGARWSLPGAQAMLWLRAIHASGSTSTYWDYHITREHHRNHLSNYHGNLALAA